VATPARVLSSTQRRARIRTKLHQMVEDHLPATGDIDVSVERNRILQEMDPVFAQEAGLVLLDEAIHNLLLQANHRRRSIFENKVTKSQKTFDDATQAWVNGDDEALDVWQQRYIVDRTHTMRPVAEMKRADLLFVAQAKQTTGNRELMRAAFFRAVAAKLPDDDTTVQEAMNELEYATLYRETFVSSDLTDKGKDN
jgi:hypothetical protein